MKRTVLTFIMIFGFLSGIGNLRAEDSNKGRQKIKSALERLSEKCGKDNAKSVFISRDPVSGFLNGKYDINTISCKTGNSFLKAAVKALEKEGDSGLGYSFVGADTPGVYEVSVGGQSVTLRQNGQSFWIIKYKNSDDPRLLDIYSLAISDESEGMLTGTVASVTVNRSEFPENNSFGLLKDAAKEKKKFVLEGYVDRFIADSCYNVYMGDVNEEITDADLVDRVVVKDKRFRYEVDIDEIMAGRIRAIFPGDELCSAWINLYFVPDFTLKVSVHNGFFNIINRYAYESKVEEAMKKYHQRLDEPVPAYNTNKAVKVVEKRNKKDSAPEVDDGKFIMSINMYKLLYEQLRNQFSFTSQMTGVAYDFKQNELKKISDQIEANFKSMTDIIEKYSANLGGSEVDSNQLAVVLNAYQELSDTLQQHLRTVSHLTGVAYDFKQMLMKRFSDQLNTVTKGMREMIDKYASTISQFDNNYILKISHE